MKKLTSLVLGAALTLAMSVPASATIIVTQSFESPPLGSGVLYAYGTPNPFAGNPGVPSASLSGSGVTFVGASGIQTNGSAFGFAPAPDGIRTAFIQSFNGVGGAIRIELANLNVGQRYFVNFAAARRSFSVPNGASNPFTVGITSGVLSSFNPTSTVFSPFTTSFVASSASDALIFQGSSFPGDATVGLDAISVAVPEPATWAMMLAGFGMIGFGLRSRRNQTVRVTYA